MVVKKLVGCSLKLEKLPFFSKSVKKMINKSAKVQTFTLQSKFIGPKNSKHRFVRGFLKTTIQNLEQSTIFQNPKHKVCSQAFWVSVWGMFERVPVFFNINQLILVVWAMPSSLLLLLVILLKMKIIHLYIFIYIYGIQ